MPCTLPHSHARASIRESLRLAFTLTELLIVVALVLLLTIAVIPVFLPALGERKIKEGVRSLQATLIAARDRAVAAGDVRGIRLVRSSADPWEVDRLVYVGTPEAFAVGTIRTNGYRVEPESKYTPTATDPLWNLVTSGPDNVAGTPDDIPRIDAPLLNPTGSNIRTLQSYIRFGSTGRTYHIVAIDNSVTPAELMLDPIEPAPPPLGAGTHYQIFNPPMPVADVSEVRFPDGVVIDVRFADILTFYGNTHPFATDATVNVPRSRGIPNQIPLRSVLVGPDGSYGTSDDATPERWPPMDILFAGNGQVVGAAAQQGLIHFWLGERADKGSEGPDGTSGTGDDIAPNKQTRLFTFSTRSGATQTLNTPLAAGTGPNYREIYDPPEQSFGTVISSVQQ